MSLFRLNKSEITKLSIDDKKLVFDRIENSIDEFRTLIEENTDLFRDKQGNFKLSNFKSKFMTILVNTNMDKSIDKIELAKREKIDDNNKDIKSVSKAEILKAGGIYDKDSPLVFSRKSNQSQSKVAILSSIKNVVCSGFYLASDSSGFKDIAILRALNYALENGINSIVVIKAEGSSRSDYATATRNVSTANILVKQARLLGVDVNISGSILGVNGAIFVLMVTLQAQSEWIGTANTNHYEKHHSYVEYLELNPQSRLLALDKLNYVQKEEIEAIVCKNETIEKSIRFLKGMIKKPHFIINKNGNKQVFCTICEQSNNQ